MSKAALHQKIIDLRSDVIKMRIQQDKDQQVIELMEKRAMILEAGLQEVMIILKGSNFYTPGAYAYHAAYKAIHSG